MEVGVVDTVSDVVGVLEYVDEVDAVADGDTVALDVADDDIVLVIL